MQASTTLDLAARVRVREREWRHKPHRRATATELDRALSLVAPSYPAATRQKAVVAFIRRRTAIPGTNQNAPCEPRTAVRPRERRDACRRGSTRAGPDSDDSSESEPPAGGEAGRRLCAADECAADISHRTAQARYCEAHSTTAARQQRARDRRKQAERVELSRSRRVGLRDPLGPRCDGCGAFFSRYGGGGGGLCWPCAHGADADEPVHTIPVKHGRTARGGFRLAAYTDVTLLAVIQHCGDWPQSSTHARSDVIAFGARLAIRLSEIQADALIDRYGSRHRACEALEMMAAEATARRLDAELAATLPELHTFEEHAARHAGLSPHEQLLKFGRLPVWQQAQAWLAQRERIDRDQDKFFIAEPEAVAA